jgi:hypothetical protein
LPFGYLDTWFTYTSGLLAIRTESDVWLFKDTGEPLLRFLPPVKNFKEINNERWSCSSTFGGRELWLASLDRKSVWRFELPRP